MASSFSTDLKIELMATGENSGTWGDKTNSNLNLVQQAIAGYQSIALTSTNTTLAMTNATISDARNAVLEFTGTITANCTIFVESGIEKTYLIKNSTSGAFTIALNQVGGSSVIWAATDKSLKNIYLNGTNATDTGLVSETGVATLTQKTLTSPIINEIDDNAGNELVIFSKTTTAVNEFTITNAITGTAPEISATGGDTNIDIKITPKGTGKVNIDGIKYPNTDGSVGQLLSTDGSGNLSFITVSSEAQFIAGSLPLAANKSTTARTAVSISKATGEVGAYPVLNTFTGSTRTITTTSAVTSSLDGSRGIIIVRTNATTTFFTGVFTPSNGTPVIGNTSVQLTSNLGGGGLNEQGVGIAIAYDTDRFLGYTAAYSNDGGGSPYTSDVRLAAFQVNTSGIITVGNVTGGGSITGGASNFGIVNQTTFVTQDRVIGLNSNLSTLNIYATNTSVSNTNLLGIQNIYQIAMMGTDTAYRPINNIVYRATINATTRLFSNGISTNASVNFFNNTATWFKVSNTRWMAFYQNATTLVREFATFDVNSTTFAFTSINSTTANYSGFTKFIGTASEQISGSVNLTTGILDYNNSGLGFNVNTLELSTNGIIKGFNVGTFLGVNAVNPYDYFQDPNNSTQAITYFVNTSTQYTNLQINAASTEQFNYCGIATANDSTTPVSVIQNGIQDGYTGLTIGSTYFANFDGTLTTVSAPITVGAALTSTQIQIRSFNI